VGLAASCIRSTRKLGSALPWLCGLMDWRKAVPVGTQDYPRADRHFAQALRRLTRIHTRSVEQPVNLDDGDDVYSYPWLCAGEMGDWKLTDAQAAKLREYSPPRRIPHARRLLGYPGMGAI